jgi:flagellar basal body rod protein FlgG
MILSWSKRNRLLWMLIFTLAVIVSTTYAAYSNISVRTDRWLALGAMSGSVQYSNGGTLQTAQVGIRLSQVGHSLRTGRGASARLDVDTGVGYVYVSENTEVVVSALRNTPNGGRITVLNIPRGQARLQVRRFTNPESELEIQTPGGVSGVRGTEFGITVHPDGKTGLATLEGAVASSAQGQTVTVNAGFQNLTIPGEPPTQPVPLSDSPNLNISTFQRSPQQRDQIQIAGTTDPVNLILINGTEQSSDRNGAFDVTVPASQDPIQILVTTPLGTQQIYELVLP